MPAPTSQLHDAEHLHSSHGSSQDSPSVARGVSRVAIFRKAACACGGGCPACTASNVSQPSDPAELEADRLADSVMNMSSGSEAQPGSSLSGETNSNNVSRKIDDSEDAYEDLDDDEPVFRKSREDSRVESRRDAEHFSPAVSGGGRPLDRGTRTFFEPRFGYDLSGVRVHEGTEAEASAKAIDAKAYTFGNDIVFGRGEYRPDCAAGRHLLAHELAHVVQSRGTARDVKRRARKRPKQQKDKKLSLEDARLVMRSIMEIINETDRSDPANWKSHPLFETYRDLLVVWYELTRSKDRQTGEKLELQPYISRFEEAKSKTQPIINLILAKGGGTAREELVQHFYPKFYEFEKEADSQKHVIELMTTTTWFPWTPTEVELEEFLPVASAKKTRPVPMQRGAGIKVGSAVAGETYYASKQEPRTVLWGSPNEGLFFTLDGVIYKQSAAGFSNDIILGTIIKAAQDVAPFVELVKFMVEMAISVSPFGIVYDVTMAAKALADGDWKEAALQLLPGPALSKASKLAKATRVGRAVFRGGAKGMRLLGNAVKSGASFIGKGLGRIKGKFTRGLWLVAEGAGEAGGKKAFYFLDDAEDVWRAIPEDEAEYFIRCSYCNLTEMGTAAHMEGRTAHAGGVGDEFAYETRPLSEPSVSEGRTGAHPDATSDVHAGDSAASKAERRSMIDDETRELLSGSRTADDEVAHAADELDELSIRFEGDRFSADMTEEDLALFAQENFPEYRYKPSTRGKVTFRGGKRVRGKRAKGDSIPDLYLPGPRGKRPISIEAKNVYIGDAAQTEDFVAHTIAQARQRAAALPKTARQHILIDLRGQHVTREAADALRQDLATRSHGIFEPGQIHFLPPSLD